jgi:hypothetical protein
VKVAQMADHPSSESRLAEPAFAQRPTSALIVALAGFAAVGIAVGALTIAAGDDDQFLNAPAPQQVGQVQN